MVSSSIMANNGHSPLSLCSLQGTALTGVPALCAGWQVKSITGEECASLCNRLANAQPDTRLQLFKDLSGSKFFSCEQGRDIMELMPDPFDKVEVAASLHTRLLDHHAFQHITGALNSAELTANL